MLEITNNKPRAQQFLQFLLGMYEHKIKRAELMKRLEELTQSVKVSFRNRPNQEILVSDWLITSHVA